MADRYWVGGTGTWDGTAGTKWATTSGGAGGASVPTSADNAIFDNNSGGAGITVTTGGTSNPCLNVDMSARTSGMTLAVNAQLDVYGNWSNGSGTTLTTAGLINFVGTNSSSLTSAGKSFPQYIYVNRTSGGGITLQDAFTSTYSATYSVILYAGTFSLNGFTATMPGFDAQGSVTRTLSLGSATLALNGLGFRATGSNFSCTGTGKISLSSGSSKTFAGNSLSYPHLENAGAGALTISGSNTFTTISNSVQPTTFSFTSGTTQTITNFSVSGTAGNLVTITSTAAGNATLSKASGTVVVSFCSITKSTATGGATWYALISDGNVNAGSNSGWIFAAAANGLFFGSNF